VYAQGTVSKPIAELNRCLDPSKEHSDLVSQYKQAMTCSNTTDTALNRQLSGIQALIDKHNQDELKKSGGSWQTDQLKRSFFMSAMRLQTLKNGLGSYINTIYRYSAYGGDDPELVKLTAYYRAHGHEKDCPDQQLCSVALAHLFCTDGSGKSTCSTEEHIALEDEVEFYKKQPGFKRESTIDAQNQLNAQLGQISDAYNSIVKPAQKKSDEMTTELDQRRTASITRSHSDRIAAQTQGQFLQTQAKIYSDNVPPASRQYFQKYSEITSQPPGVLLYSSVVQDALKQQSVGDRAHYKLRYAAVAEGMAEVRKNIIDSKNSANADKSSFDSGNPSAMQDAIENNPFAAGQVFAQHPEMVSAACLSLKSIELNKKIKEYGKMALQGAVLVGGVVVSCVFPPAGLAVAIGLDAAATLINDQDQKQTIASEMQGAVTGNKQVDVKQMNTEREEKKQVWSDFGKRTALNVIVAGTTFGLGKIVTGAKNVSVVTKLESSEGSLTGTMQSASNLGRNTSSVVNVEESSVKAWTESFSGDPAKLKAWDEFNSLSKVKNMSTEQRDLMMKDLYEAHITGNQGATGNMTKMRALSDVKSDLVNKYGFTMAEAKDAVQSLAKNGVLGESPYEATFNQLSKIDFNKQPPDNIDSVLKPFKASRFDQKAIQNPDSLLKEFKNLDDVEANFVKPASSHPEWSTRLKIYTRQFNEDADAYARQVDILEKAKTAGKLNIDEETLIQLKAYAKKYKKGFPEGDVKVVDSAPKVEKPQTNTTPVENPKMTEIRNRGISNGQETLKNSDETLGWYQKQGSSLSDKPAAFNPNDGHVVTLKKEISQLDDTIKNMTNMHNHAEVGANQASNDLLASLKNTRASLEKNLQDVNAYQSQFVSAVKKDPSSYIDGMQTSSLSANEAPGNLTFVLKQVNANEVSPAKAKKVLQSVEDLMETKWTQTSSADLKDEIKTLLSDANLPTDQPSGYAEIDRLLFPKPVGK